MKKRLVILCLAIASVSTVFYSCSEDVAESTEGSISGIVSDSATGEAIPTVKITVTPGGDSTITGSDGTFSFYNLSAGEYTLSLSKKGYEDYEGKVTVSGKETHAHLLMERIPAVITIDREELDFGENASMNTLSFNMVNNNYVDLEYRVIENCGWIEKVDPAEGILPYGKTATVVVQINREYLLAGVNETVVVVSTSDGSSEITVKATGVQKGKATLNTLDVTNIKASSARFNGEIVSSGHPAYTERGFVYNDAPLPDHQNTIAVVTAMVTDDKTFSVAVEGLELGKTYYVRAYAINEYGTAYSSNQVSFTTHTTLATVELLDYGISTENMDVSFYGKISDKGDPAYTECGFVYSSTNTVPTIFDTKIPATADINGVFEVHNLKGFEYDVTYYVCAYATNAAGTAYSGVEKLLLKTSLPTVNTLSITDMSEEHHSAVLHGEITNAGLPAYTERGFVYSDIYESPTIYDNKLVVEGNGVGKYEYRVTELSSDRAYYVRAYATSEKGTNYGKVVKLFQKDWIELPSAGIAVQPQDAGSGDWEDANNMCENSIHAGVTDWRLPTLDELFVLYNNRDYIGGFNDMGRYWSSTLYYNTDDHWYVEFYDGSSTGCPNDYSRFARCVRDLK